MIPGIGSVAVVGERMGSSGSPQALGQGGQLLPQGQLLLLVLLLMLLLMLMLLQCQRRVQRCCGESCPSQRKLLQCRCGKRGRYLLRQQRLSSLKRQELRLLLLWL